MRKPGASDPFGEILGEFAERLGGNGWRPDVDVFETAAAVVVHAEMAGVSSEELRVTVDGSELKISGVRRPPEGSDVERLHQMEIASGPFERRLKISVPFDRAGVTAHLADGFLTVKLPKAVRQKIGIENADE